MARVVIYLLVLCCTLDATPYIFTTCSAGTTTDTPCPPYPFGLSGPGYEVMAEASAGEARPPTTGIGGFPDLPGAEGQSAITHAEASIYGPVVIPLYAVAQASDAPTYDSGGLLRPGFIQFEVALNYGNADYHDQFSPMAMFTDGTHQYTYSGGGGVYGSTPPSHCYIEDCEYTATVPFDLGTQFEVSVSGHSAAGITMYGGFGQDGDAQVLFRLLEADGTTLVPFTVVPEATSRTMLLLAAGMGGCLVWRQRRRPAMRGESPAESRAYPKRLPEG